MHLTRDGQEWCRVIDLGKVAVYDILQVEWRSIGCQLVICVGRHFETGWSIIRNAVATAIGIEHYHYRPYTNVWEILQSVHVIVCVYKRSEHKQ